MDLTVLDNLKKELKNVRLTEQNQSIYTKVEALINLATSRLNSEYALFLNSSENQSIEANLNGLLSHIQNDIQHPEAQYYNALPQFISPLLASLRNIPEASSEHTKQNLNSIISNFKAQTAKQNDNLKEIEGKFEEKVASLQRQLEQKEAEVSQLASTFQEQFSKAQEKRLSDFGTQSEELKKEFAKTQKEKEDEFKLYAQNRTKKDQEVEKQINNAFQNTQRNATQMLNSIKDIKQEVEKMYGLIGKTILIGDKKHYADNAKSRADWMFYIGVGIMMLTAGIVIWPLLDKFSEILTSDKKVDLFQFDWWILVPRILVTFILLLPAFYFLKESKDQRHQENKLRDLEIKLNAIDPYLLQIQAQQENNISLKDKVKLELAKELLGKDKEEKYEGRVIPKDVIETIETVGNAIAKIRK